MRVLVLGLVASVAGCTSAPEPVHDGGATVVGVVDGDTIVVEVVGRTETVRLIGIDTPESVHPDRPVECLGPQAAAFTAGLLPPGTEIRISRDVVGRDHYDRLLGYVHRVDDGLFVNAEIVRRGFARPLSIAPNESHRRTFVAAARAADADDLGLWAECVGSDAAPR